MKIKSIKSTKNLKGKTVIVRCDFDVPLKQLTTNNQQLTKIEDYTRLDACLPTIKYLLKKKVKKIILIGSLGRPEGEDNKFSLTPVLKYLNKKLPVTCYQLPVTFDRYLSKKTQEKINVIPDKIVLLENLRFSDREQANCKRLAKNLASLANIYINESFAMSHRTVSSMNAIQDYLPSYAGLHLEKEIKNLSAKFKKPLVIIIGGAKIETKLPVINHFIKSADYILVGGATANNFLKVKGVDVGQSLVDDKYIKEAEKLLKKQKTRNEKQINFKPQLPVTSYQLLLPLDVITQDGKNKSLNEIKKTDRILDIGPKTIILFNGIIKKAQTVIWNGPMGLFENQKFAIGTHKIADTILSSKAQILVGGGETNEIFKNKKIPKNIFISTGGGAMLEFLAGKKLPGLKKLTK